MKRLATLLVCICLLAGVAFTQQTAVPDPALQESYSNGTYNAPNFGKWQVPVGAAIAANGTVLTASYAVVTTPDGITFAPFAAKEKITIGLGSTQETGTISSVSNCNAGSGAVPGQAAVCQITLSSGVTNAHSIGEPIVSADNGIIEAITYAQQTGGGPVFWKVDCGIITLSTSGLTTTSTCFVPNSFYNQGGACRVTTTITTSANWEVGVTGALTSFCGQNSTLTAGTTAFTLQAAPAANLVTSATAADLAAVLITAGTSNAGAGKVHVKAWGFTVAQPAY